MGYTPSEKSIGHGQVSSKAVGASEAVDGVTRKVRPPEVSAASESVCSRFCIASDSMNLVRTICI